MNDRCRLLVVLQLFREVKIMKMLDHPNIGNYTLVVDEYSVLVVQLIFYFQSYQMH